MNRERLPSPLFLLIALSVPFLLCAGGPGPMRPAEGDGICERPDPPFAVCGEAVRYDADGWRTPPGPPPGGLYSVGGTVDNSHHCGNHVEMVVIGADGGRKALVYEDRPCQETARNAGAVTAKKKAFRP